MGERAVPLFLVAALPLVAGLSLLIGSKPGSPPELRAGEVHQLSLAAGQEQSFPLRLAPGAILHLAIDQQGLDLEIAVGAPKGPLLPAIDLPFGSRVREEVWLEATGAGDELLLRIRALDGRGRPRLEVLFAGPGGPGEKVRARDFAMFWRSSRQPPAARRRLLQWLAEQAAEPRQRLLAAAALGSFELGAQDPALAMAAIERALALLAQAPEEALLGQLQILRARAAARLGDTAQALAGHYQALATAARCEDWAGAALAENDLGNWGWRDNNSYASIRHFAASRRYFGKAGYLADAREQEVNLARSLMRRGSSPEPLALLLRALAENDAAGRATGQVDPPRARLLREIAWWLYLEGRYAEARPLLELAVARDPDSVDALKHLADTLVALGDPQAARRRLGEALVRMSRPLQRGSLESALCRIDFAQGLIAAARGHCESAIVQLESGGLRGGVPAVELMLAKIEQRDGRLAAAEQRARSACAAFESQRRQAGGNQEKLDFSAARNEGPALLVELRLALAAEGSGELWRRRALEAAESNRARLLQDLLADADADSDADGTGRTGDRGRAGDAERRRREQELRQILERLNRDLIASLVRHGELELPRTRLLDAPLQRLEELREELDGPAGPPAIAPDQPAPSFELAAVQRELEPGAAMLIYHLGERDAFGWVLTAGAARGVPLGESASLRDLARSLHGQWASGADVGAGEAWAGRLAQRIYAPFAVELERARQVVVVAPAELQRVPFAALPFPAGSGQPLIASRELAALPSAAILPALRRRARSRPSGARRLAIVDDPVYDGDSRLPAAARRAGPFPPLPDTAAEGRRLLELAGDARSVRITGFAATRENLLGGALADFRILHFAVHGRTEEAPRGLVLSRYDAAGKRIGDAFGFPELAALSLNADLAVTTACSSALGEEVAGEGLLGLSQGFLAAGIPRLLLTLWPVRGEPSRRLVEQFYGLLLAGQAPAEALGQTQRAMRREGRPPHEWAAYALYGDWGPLPGFSRAGDQHGAPARVDKPGRGKQPPPSPNYERSSR